MNVVDDWMHDETFGDDLFDLCRRVGDTYRPDTGIAESDPGKMVEWYGKEAAGGFSYSLGAMYMGGLGVEADPAKAREICLLCLFLLAI